MQGTPASQQDITGAVRSWPPPQGEWTYEDWRQLPDDGYRYEVINGTLLMSPPPSTQHQRISVRIEDCLREFLRSHPVGEFLHAPVGVRLPNQPVPLQPDIIFIRAERLGIIGETYIEGVPDLLVEILSPSNWLYDRREKMQAYQGAGVAEYWIVDPRAITVEVYVLEQSTYVLAGQYRTGEIASSRLLPGFVVPVDAIFVP
jgi:Uma2 family endonuclease